MLDVDLVTDTLNGQVPSSRYKPSTREYTGKLLDPEYDSGEIVRRVHRHNGYLRFKGKHFRVGLGLEGEQVAITETKKEDKFSIFFMDSFIKKFTLNEGCK